MTEQIDEVTESKSFMKSMIVIDPSFLDKTLLLNAYPEWERTYNKYFEWHTGRKDTDYSKELSNHLISKGTPRDSMVLIDMSLIEIF